MPENTRGALAERGNRSEKTGTDSNPTAIQLQAVARRNHFSAVYAHHLGADAAREMRCRKEVASVNAQPLPIQIRPDRRKIRRNLVLLCSVLGCLFGVGVLLIVTSPLDDAARNNIGSALVSGTVPGVVLLGLGVILDQRLKFASRLEKASTVEAMLDTARDRLASVAFEYMELLAARFLQEPPGEVAPSARPAGMVWPDDWFAVRTSLIWRTEVMGDSPSWWKSEREIALSDAVFLVALDLLERLDISPYDELNENSLDSLSYAWSYSLDRIKLLAQRLSQSDAALDAATLDAKVTLIEMSWGRGQSPPSYRTSRSGWQGEDGIERPLLGPSPISDFETHFSWLTSEIRPTTIRVDRDGDPIAEVQLTREAYRWGPLIPPGKYESDDLWESRFAVGSWFRELLETSNDAIRATKIGRLANPT